MNTRILLLTVTFALGVSGQTNQSTLLILGSQQVTIDSNGLVSVQTIEPSTTGSAKSDLPLPVNAYLLVSGKAYVTALEKKPTEEKQGKPTEKKQVWVVSDRYHMRPYPAGSPVKLLDPSDTSRRLILFVYAKNPKHCTDCTETVLFNIGTDGKSSRWVIGLRATNEGLEIEKELIDSLDLGEPQTGSDAKKCSAKSVQGLTVVINGRPLRRDDAGRVFGSRDTATYNVEVYEPERGCRRYSLPYLVGSKRPDSVDVEIPVLELPQSSDNGITVGAPKIFDSWALRTRWNNAAQQLAQISPWNASAIAGAYGNIQGVTRDTSYIAAQLMSTPTPSVQTTLSGPVPGTAPSTVTTTQNGVCPSGFIPTIAASGGLQCTPVAVTNITGTNGVCTAGTFPAIGAGGTLTCVPLAGNAAQSLPVSLTNTQTTSPAATTLQTVTNNQSYSPAIPAAPTSTAFNAPSTNMSVSSADMLAEQVQLNAQLQIYQMLLLGAESDQVLLRNSRAVANRGQTTIGIPITISPPRQFRHAIAEVRIAIVPHAPSGEYLSSDSERLSIVNLLPSQKTYNVAKITSRQKSFGASVVVEAVNAGFSTGKTKDRLYLAKDTDTVALEYPDLTVPLLHPPFPERSLTGLEALFHMERLDDCDNEWTSGEEKLNPASMRSSLTFGWQFRPVLGADYVAPGPREVFAQLALPGGLDDGLEAAVYVQTRWREYDEKRQVAGPIYHRSCNWTRVTDPIVIVNPIRVKNVTWQDAGNGILKVTAQGNLLAPGLTVMSGGSSISESVFEGRTLQFFATARDLIRNGDMNIVGEDGQLVPVTVPLSRDGSCECDIKKATLEAAPLPDGNSAVKLVVKFGAGIDAEHDDVPRPLVLIGDDVYGLKEKPYLDRKCSNGCGPTCTFHFQASTDSLRAGEKFLVRDISWEHMSYTGRIRFGPSFTAISNLTSGHGAGTKKGSDSGNNYVVTGTDLHALKDLKANNDGDTLLLYTTSNKALSLTDNNFKVLSDTTALMTIPEKLDDGQDVRFAWRPDPRSFYTPGALPIAWDLALPAGPACAPAPDPPFLAEGDSRTITFTGCDFSAVTSVSFEATTLLNLKAQPTGTRTDLKVPIPLSVTGALGHKDLIAHTADANKPVTLSIEVVKP